MSNPLLAYYCVFILIASIGGGMIPHWVRLTHRRMEMAVSFVAGVMLGVALLHLLPHALEAAMRSANADGSASVGQGAVIAIMLWLIAGFLAMFFIERFFCYHHHEIPGEETDASSGEPSHAHTHCDHSHDITWSGATLGLTLHSVLAGVALAAGVAHGTHGGALAGFGTFLVIVLHKPLDSMTIAMLMARGGWSPLWQHAVNGLFALAIPVGVVLFHLGIGASEQTGAAAIDPWLLPPALSFSAGMFLCIAMSDLLPELQFHQHDRIKLSAALLAGLLLAFLAGQLEDRVGGHNHGTPKENQSPQALATESHGTTTSGSKRP